MSLRSHKIKWVFVLVCLCLLTAVKPAQANNKDSYQDQDLSPDNNVENNNYVGPHIVVNIPARQLRVYDENNDLVKIYPIAVGMSGHRTPVGPRLMSQIVWNPWWLPPPDSEWAKGAKPTPPGLHNPLGPVKMNLGSAILMHGTNKPKSVGFAASHGCMRLVSSDAKELARWIQEKVTDKNTEDVFANYNAHSGRSFYVQLEHPVPVEIIYEVVEIDNGAIIFHPDVYGKVGNKVKLVEQKLSALGYDPSKFNWNLIKQTLSQIKGAKDVNLRIQDLMIDSGSSEDTGTSVALIQ